MPLVFLQAVMPYHGVSNWGLLALLPLQYSFVGGLCFGLLVPEWCIITVIKTCEGAHLERLHNVLVITFYGSGIWNWQ
jgi:hypothetical protein